MLIFLPLLIFIGSAAANKQGDFGIFFGCNVNNSLRLRCFYAHCPDSPPYECEFFTSTGSRIAKESNKKCRIIIPNHRVLYGNTTTSYNCTLTRMNRKEHKHVTIDYGVRLGKKRIKKCRNSSRWRLRPAPRLLWPAVILSLWGVLFVDGQPS